MNPLDKIINALSETYDTATEIAFEKALRDAMLYRIDDFAITTPDNDTFIPLFTNELEAEAMGVHAPIYVTYLKDVQFSDDQTLVINPMNQAITLDAYAVDAILDVDVQTEITTHDNTSLSFLFFVKPLLEDTPTIVAAYLAKLVTGRRSSLALVLEGIANDETVIRSLVDQIAPHFPKGTHCDVFTHHDTTGQTIIKSMKPFYKK